MFAFRPAAISKKPYVLTRFGPVGIAIELGQPAFTMKVKTVEPGSPAEKTGLKPNMMIETINGQKLKDIDPRIQLGEIITKAEAGNGEIQIAIAGGKNFSVKIPALGSYSPTWPMNCPKSDKIVRNLAEHLKRELKSKTWNKAQIGFSDIGILYLLSTGDESDLAAVRKYMHDSVTKRKASTYAWYWGYDGITFCEYYLRTGDEIVLPVIQRNVNIAVEREYFGGWGGKGLLASTNYGGGGGHLNAASTLPIGFLMLAKECGANVPDDTLLRCLKQFYRYAGRGVVPYGNNMPEMTYVDNGKTGALAISMSAAAALAGQGDESIYAQARDTAAMHSFYSTSYMLIGHTGGGIGEVWRSNAMGLLHEKKPNHYRQFMDGRRWHYELSRRFDGTFGILAGGRYDNEEWGAGYALTYTMPRKTLRISGAPAGPYSKPYKLPENPWGTKQDMMFVSPTPPQFPNGTFLDTSKETLEDHTGIPLNKLFRDPEVKADTIRNYMHHPDYVVRMTAGWELYKFEPAFLTEFLEHKDPRVRCAAMAGTASPYDNVNNFDGVKNLIDEKNYNLIVSMLKDPQESWFVKKFALDVLAKLPEKSIIEQADLIISYLKHEEWWLQSAAVDGLVKIMGHPDCYKTVLPALGEFYRTNSMRPLTWPLREGNGRKLKIFKSANPEIQKLALESFKDAYIGFQPVKAKNPINSDKVNFPNKQNLGTILSLLPGGKEVLAELKKSNPAPAPTPAPAPKAATKTTGPAKSAPKTTAPAKSAPKPTPKK